MWADKLNKRFLCVDYENILAWVKDTMKQRHVGMSKMVKKLITSNSICGATTKLSLKTLNQPISTGNNLKKHTEKQ